MMRAMALLCLLLAAAPALAQIVLNPPAPEAAPPQPAHKPAPKKKPVHRAPAPPRTVTVAPIPEEGTALPPMRVSRAARTPVNTIPLPPIPPAAPPGDAAPADGTSANTLPNAPTTEDAAMPSKSAAVCVANADIAELQRALAAGETTSAALVRAYVARIEAYDRAGPMLNSVRELNPDAAAIAESADAAPKGAKRLPLQGIPILLKDNITTDDNQHTTAGSLALAEARGTRDATLVAKLRRAGAVILGKANLTEFANILAVGMPSGYSSVGGQVRNAYAPDVDGKGVPVVPPGGSSSGSAVAVAAGFAAASVGTETSGSLLSPANQNGLVTVKPTVGLISRAGIAPIAASQDTAGPMTRTVRDAALLLGVMAGPDGLDPMTARAPKIPDYLKALDKDGLKGARIGVPSNPADPGNDVYYRPLRPDAAAVMEGVVKVLAAQGAVIVRENMPTEGWIGGPGTDMAILNRNPESPNLNQVARLPVVFVYELKHDMNQFLHDWLKGTNIRTLGDVITFNAANPERALRFGQDIFLAAEATRGELQEQEYLSARQMDLRASRSRGLDAYMDENRLDAVLFPGAAGASIAAKAGYPSVQVPAGFVSGIEDKQTPEYPMGATFTGRAWSEALLLRLAYAFEQATLARKMPPGVQELGEGCR
jgi:amidase